MTSIPFPRRARGILDAIVNVALVGAIVAACAVIVRRDLRSAPAAEATSSAKYVAEWKAHRAEGITVGRVDAPIQIVELADFECPACRLFHQTLSEVRPSLRDSIAVTFIHFPLAYHSQALRAATAAECAATQGRFAEYADSLFHNQHLLAEGLYAKLARTVGVSDHAAFKRCLSQPDTSARIRAGIAVGAAMGLEATPTILINGWRQRLPPNNPSNLDSAIRLALTATRP